MQGRRRILTAEEKEAEEKKQEEKMRKREEEERRFIESPLGADAAPVSPLKEESETSAEEDEEEPMLAVFGLGDEDKDKKVRTDHACAGLRSGR